MFENIDLLPDYKLRLASEDDIPQIKELDDMAFSNQKGISDQEILEIISFGTIILLFDCNNLLVGESQILLEDSEIIRPLKLLKSYAYYYGTAIHPKEQGHGIGRIMASAQDEIARIYRKYFAVATVRAENYPSLRLRLSTGFRIIRFNPTFYGPALDNGARAIISKKLSGKFNCPVEKSIVEIQFGDNPDIKAQNDICLLLKKGFRGVDVKGSKNGAGVILFEK